MEMLLEGLLEDWHNVLRIMPRLAVSAVIFGSCIWIGRMAGRGLIRLLEKGDLSRTHRSFFRTATVWLFALVGLVVVFNLLGLKGLSTSLLAGGGVTAVVLGFAFREIGENFLAGFVLAFSRPFEIGDFIQSEGLQGEVRGIELRHTHIRTPDGCDIFVPSAQFVNKPLMNFTRDGLRRPSFIVGIDYADDAQKACETLLDVVKGTGGVLKEPKSNVFLSALAPQYVELEVSFWVDTFQKGITLPQIRTAVMERCRRALLEQQFTVSSNVVTGVEIGGRKPVELRLLKHPL